MSDDAKKFDLTTREGKQRYFHYLAQKEARADFEKDGLEWEDVPYDPSFYSNKTESGLMGDIIEFEDYSGKYFDTPGDKIKRGFSSLFIFTWQIFKVLLWLLFVMPGSLITWSQYYFPQKGKIYATGRRKNNFAVKVIFSISFWISMSAVGGGILYFNQNRPLVAAILSHIQNSH